MTTTVNADDRPIVMIYGDCQAQYLLMLLEHIPWTAGRFSFHLVTDTVEPHERTASIPPEAKRAALLWEQYDQRAINSRRDEVRSQVPRDCMVVRFPGICMHALWPFRVKDPRNRPEPAYPWGRYPFGDRIALEVVDLGLHGARAFDRYMELSHAAMPDVHRLLDMERRMVYARQDAVCDVGASEFIFARIRDVHQFWTHGHVAGSVMTELLCLLLERSVSVFGEPSEAVREELAMLSTRFPGQGTLQFPLHPLVIEQLGLTFANENTRYRWYDNAWTFEEFITRYIAFDCTW